MFKECPSWPGYFVNSSGEVENRASSHPNAKTKATKYLDKDGYLRVWLKAPSGERKFVPVHRLVAITFLDPPPEALCVNHKNGNRKDNSASNLEWLSAADNERHARKVLGKRLLGEKASRSKLNSSDVLNIRTLAKKGTSREKIAASFSISVTQVVRIINKKNWSHI